MADAEAPVEPRTPEIRFVSYESEVQMPDIIQLVQRDLSEPYSVYTYRYFIHNWGKLCFLAYDGTNCVGVIVCKLETRDKNEQTQHDLTCTPSNQAEPSSNGINNIMPTKLTYKGYIAMLVVEKNYRKLKIGSKLVKLAVNAMKDSGADEIYLETEVTNKPAQKLYENLGFLRDKRLFRYYLNGLDALRLKLWLT